MPPQRNQRNGRITSAALPKKRKKDRKIPRLNRPFGHMMHQVDIRVIPGAPTGSSLDQYESPERQLDFSTLSLAEESAIHDSVDPACPSGSSSNWAILQGNINVPTTISPDQSISQCPSVVASSTSMASVMRSRRGLLPIETPNSLLDYPLINFESPSAQSTISASPYTSSPMIFNDPEELLNMGMNTLTIGRNNSPGLLGSNLSPYQSIPSPLPELNIQLPFVNPPTPVSDDEFFIGVELPTLDPSPRSSDSANLRYLSHDLLVDYPGADRSKSRTASFAGSSASTASSLPSPFYENQSFPSISVSSSPHLPFAPAGVPSYLPSYTVPLQPSHPRISVTEYASFDMREGRLRNCPQRGITFPVPSSIPQGQHLTLPPTDAPFPDSAGYNLVPQRNCSASRRSRSLDQSTSAWPAFGVHSPSSPRFLQPPPNSPVGRLHSANYQGTSGIPSDELSVTLGSSYEAVFRSQSASQNSPSAIMSSYYRPFSSKNTNEPSN